jgi:predicted MFS family arabinose efflux permease
VFFGISGGLTAIGPIAGGFLTQWTWRSIFWINVPVALVALYLIHRSQPEDARHPSPLDHRGTVLACAGLGLFVLGLQQASQWGWGGAATLACLVVGLALCVAFVAWELRAPDPLLNLRIFRDRAFAADALILTLMSVVFVPFFFFGSVYAQVSLGLSASKAGLYILYFFLGFVVAAQIGGRILDRRGARPSVVIGSVVGAVGFYLLARRLPDLSLTQQWPVIALSGAGLGFILGPASTDAVNRAPASAYSEVTGLTQTGRNLGASLGLAVLGTVLIDRSTTTITSALAGTGVPHAQAEKVAQSFGSASGAGAGGASPAQVHAVQLAFAHATQTVFYAMAAVLVANLIVARVGLPRAQRAPVEEPVAA